MHRFAFAIIALMAFAPLSSRAASITVKPGETLSEIAERNGISLRALLKLNGISNSDHIEAGQILRLPNAQGGVAKAGSGSHRVSEGDTLGGIAMRYRVREQDLIAINNLQHADHIELGQKLKLPQGAVLPKPKPTPIRANPNAKYHTVANGQTLSQIAMAYQVPVATLVDINGINDPNKVNAGIKLYLRRRSSKPSSKTVQLKPEITTQKQVKPATVALATKSTQSIKPIIDNQTIKKPSKKNHTKTNTPTSKTVNPSTIVKPSSSTKPIKTSVKVSSKAKYADWRTYGPLQVDWANWQSMGGSYVVPTLNSSGQPLYIAVNCSARQLNATDINGKWKSWNIPNNGFERDLIQDRCKSKLS